MLKRIWDALRGVTPPPPIDPPPPAEGPYTGAYRRAISLIDGDTDCTILTSYRDDQLYHAVRYEVLWSTDSIRSRRHLVISGYPLFDDLLRDELDRAVEDWHERRLQSKIRKAFP